ncbi:MAG: gliding motility-associated C-terminal domain-containing protein [Ferruginibacter sp.]
MKTLLPVALIAATILLANCKKSEDSITHVNCDGLVTDTPGTNDNAKIYMPNAFTPNGDGLNDIIRPYTQNIASIEFTIYDENNAIVFTTNQLAQGWVTTAGPNSSTKYYYKIQTITSANHKIGMCGDLYKLTCHPNNAPTLYFEDQLTANGFTGATNEALQTCP